MKILHINTTDIIGGAAIAASRLHYGLNEINCESYMWVQTKYSDDFKVIGPQNKIQRIIAKISPTLDGIYLLPYRKREKVSFTPACISSGLKKTVKSIDPDIIHLHWVAGGFLRIEELNRLKKPIVWTLHDMWPFTGGCHYDNDCGLYRDRCIRCPQLNSSFKIDLSSRIQKRKLKAWRKSNIHVVAPSRWLGDCASKSKVFENSSVKVIPNGINTKVFRRIEKKLARELLDLPEDKKLILFAAISPISQKRKGYHFLREALEKIARYDFELMILGASRPEKNNSFRYNINYLGQMNDDISLSLAYSAADVFVAPSIQDNLPNTVVESLSCGTPCIAFRIGGMSDMIVHKNNGYLSKPFNTSDLVDGINWIFKDDGRYQVLSMNARAKVEKDYNIIDIAKKYKDLYLDILNYSKKK